MLTVLMVKKMVKKKKSHLKDSRKFIQIKELAGGRIWEVNTRIELFFSILAAENLGESVGNCG
jgi:hypothetical protein